MKFLAITLIVHRPDPVTGVQKPTHDRFREVLDNALLAEELGFDGFGVGEWHERPFISSSPPIVLSHVAALTERIRLFTAVTTLSQLDLRASRPHNAGSPVPRNSGRGFHASAGQALHLHLPAGSGASFLGPPTHERRPGVVVTGSRSSVAHSWS